MLLFSCRVLVAQSKLVSQSKLVLLRTQRADLSQHRIEVQNDQVLWVGRSSATQSLKPSEEASNNPGILYPCKIYYLPNVVSGGVLRTADNKLCVLIGDMQHKKQR